MTTEPSSLSDITADFADYRLAKANLWALFRPRIGSLRDEIIDSFELIDVELFYAIVLSRRHKESKNLIGREALSFLHVVPRYPDAGLSVMIGTELENGNRTFSRAVLMTRDDHLELRFVSCFDWDLYGSPTFPFVDCMVIGCGTQADFIGRPCLVETHAVRVLLDEQE